MAPTPFSNAPPPEAVRGAALQGIRDRAGGPAQAPQQAQQGPVPGGGGSVPAMFADLTQAIMQEVGQTGFTPALMSAFEQFIQFFQEVVAQASGGAQPGAAPQGPPVAQGQVAPPAAGVPLG